MTLRLPLNTFDENYIEVVAQIFGAFNWQKCNHNVVIIVLPDTTFCGTVI